MSGGRAADRASTLAAKRASACSALSPRQFGPHYCRGRVSVADFPFLSGDSEIAPGRVIPLRDNVFRRTTQKLRHAAEVHPCRFPQGQMSRASLLRFRKSFTPHLSYGAGALPRKIAAFCRRQDDAVPPCLPGVSAATDPRRKLWLPAIPLQAVFGSSRIRPRLVWESRCRTF